MFRNIFDKSFETIEYVEQGNWVTGEVVDDTEASPVVASIKDERYTDISTRLQQTSPLYLAVFGAFDVAQQEYCKHFPLCIHSGTHYNVLRYGKGQFYNEHVDQGWGCLDRVLSGILFLNENFEGGEVYFSSQDVTVVPETGMLVLFPSNFLFPHLVTPVTAGVRYSVVSWMS